MSTSWYKPFAVPKLLRAFPKNTNSASIVEVWNTTCVVTNFGKPRESSCSVLINPSNPTLTGVKKFPYFPRGGPEPIKAPEKYEHHIMGYVSQWGGMEVGTGMLFPFNVVDGVVHQLGGWKLKMLCQWLPEVQTNEKCPVGHAVSTYPGGKELEEQFDEIIHTVPPFYEHHPDPEVYLARCYQNALSLAFSSLPAPLQQRRVASPLLGAGGRGFPLEKAIHIAAEESLRWRDNLSTADKQLQGETQQQQVLAFGIPDINIAEKLVTAIEQIERK